MRRLVLTQGAGCGELLRFCLIGASGYLVNLAAYAVLLHAGVQYAAAAVSSFAIAVVNNYTWNRVWTFRHRRGGIYGQGLRFLAVAVCSLGGNLLLLHAMVDLHVDKLAAQALAIVAVTPFNFIGSKLWAFARPRAAAIG